MVVPKCNEKMYSVRESERGMDEKREREGKTEPKNKKNIIDI